MAETNVGVVLSTAATMGQYMSGRMHRTLSNGRRQWGNMSQMCSIWKNFRYMWRQPMQESVLRIKATRLKVLGMATTKENTTPKNGAKRCGVTFRMETNVPRSFPVNRTNTKGKNSCIVSSESQSILSNHRRNDEPNAKIKERRCFAIFFCALCSSRDLRRYSCRPLRAF